MIMVSETSLIEEWHPTKNRLSPQRTAAGSHLNVWWLGKCGHEWEAPVSARTKRFRNDPELQYVEGYTEKQLAELNNLPRIWDAGKTRWVKKI